MATVWLAYDERLQRLVAIKVISEALATNPAALARFAREVRTHAGIQHRNLVQVYDYSVRESRPYLVMEFVRGHTLSERMDRGAMPAAAIQTLATDLLSAIACVHDHGVLHRDIKSGNVLIDDDGNARLTDFGLARLEDATQITRTNEVVGTLRFLAPELIEGRPATRQSDLYALGVLLRTAAGDTKLPASLSTLIPWLTKHDPRQRPADAHAALAVLHGAKRPRRSRPAHNVRTRSHATGQSTEPLTPSLPSAETRAHSSGNRLRSRTAAISALVVAVAVLALAVIGAGGSPAPARAKSFASGPRKRTISAQTSTRLAAHPAAAARTLDQRLQRLADEVKRAATT